MLFNDSSVLKILLEGGVLELFTDYVKYPRTYHLPWSEGVTDDDRILTDLSNFAGKKIIVTEKLDGENTTLYKDHIHARSVDSKNHPTRDRVKAIWASIAHDIPEKWRLCGENMYAKHSIHYTELESYLYIFSIWDEHNHSLSWDDTVLYASLLNLNTVPVLYAGTFCEKTLRDIASNLNKDTTEGYVVRLADRFSYQAFRNSVVKFVRANHVTSDSHWLMGKSITPNKLKHD
jgi:ATP-dependent RNA circularization protein (DNA/RNA ligase family)